jgi:hypothetical protein
MKVDIEELRRPEYVPTARELQAAFDELAAMLSVDIEDERDELRTALVNALEDQRKALDEIERLRGENHALIDSYFLSQKALRREGEVAREFAAEAIERLRAAPGDPWALELAEWFEREVASAVTPPDNVIAQKFLAAAAILRRAPGLNPDQREADMRAGFNLAAETCRDADGQRCGTHNFDALDAEIAEMRGGR